MATFFSDAASTRWIKALFDVGFNPAQLNSVVNSWLLIPTTSFLVFKVCFRTAVLVWSDFTVLAKLFDDFLAVSVVREQTALAFWANISIRTWIDKAAIFSKSRG